ncbi:MAG: hypothetical protein ACK5XN_33385 [Bacteroidota bacterium]
MDSVLLVPADTIRNKSGVVRIGTQLYAGNGSYWTVAGNGGGGADSSVFFTKFRSDTMRTNVYNAIANVPTPTLQQSFNISTYPQIDFSQAASGKFAIYNSQIDASESGLYMDQDTKSFLLGDNTKGGSYLEVQTGADITINSSSELILKPDSAQTGYVWTAKNNSGHGEWRAAASGNGTVTSVGTGYGLSGGTITTSGTLTVDTSVSGLSGKYLRISDTTNKFLSAVSQPNDSSLTFTKDGTTSTFIIRSAIAGSATRLVTTVYNNSGATIAKGSVVYISGRHSSNLPTIELATGNTEENSYKTFALADANISNNSSGIVIQAGNITGLNLPTSSFTDGDIVYLSPTVPGGITITKPLAPNHICKIGSVTRAHPTLGSIEIKIENGWQLDELSDVQIAAVPADSVLLQFSRTDSLWHDRTITQAIGPYLNAKKNSNDSTGNAGYTTLFQRNKLRDSIIAITDFLNEGLISLNQSKKANSDSTGNAGYTTLFSRNKLKDSLQANINLKANLAGPTFTDSLVLTSTVGGISLPNMTQTQMNAITPRVGTQVYNTTYDAVCTFTNDFGWWSNEQPWVSSNGFMVFDEFITYAYNSNQNGNFFQIQNSNGTWTSATPLSNRPGILTMSTATSAVGRLTVQADGIGLASNILSGGKLIYETDVQIPTLSSAAQTFQFFTGFSSTNTNVSTNSIAFLYDSAGTNTGSAAIGRWQVVCANGSTRSYTTTDSTVTAGRWYRLRAEVNAAGNSVAFYINGALVKTETNNIPTGAVTPVTSIIKTVGTTARTAWLDFIRIRQKFTNPR